MDHVSQTPHWGSFALVSYIPEPLGSFLDGLRQSLSGDGVPQAHITLLPPRPLLLSVELASEQVLKLLTGFRAFPVELSAVRRFRQTNVLYLDVGEGSARLHALHDALNRGDLAHNEEFEFRPHLTLGIPPCPRDIEPLRKLAQAAWESAPVTGRFLLYEIVCLWLPHDGLPSQWQRLWSHNLETRQTLKVPDPTFAVTSQTY